jgi:hypothetical protein
LWQDIRSQIQDETTVPQLPGETTTVKLISYFGQAMPVREPTMTRLGEYRYNGNGQTLENDTEYTAYETDSGVEMYPEGASEPITVNRGNFTQMQNRTLEPIEGDTPMR